MITAFSFGGRIWSPSHGRNFGGRRGGVTKGVILMIVT